VEDLGGLFSFALGCLGVIVFVVAVRARYGGETGGACSD
jgi:hypothetical protein